MQPPKKKIVVIGGGTGTYTLLRGLKAYAHAVDITAIVTMADSGGSTGRLRDEFGGLPMGDARMALCALADDVDADADVLRELFLYRFAKGEGLSGHNFGNLLLTALTEIVGDTSTAIETAGKILRIKGSVIPVTSDNVQLVATYTNGVVVTGEHYIDTPPVEMHDYRIINLAVTPKATINPKAATAITEADMVVLGPGDLYTSILANCVVDGVQEAVSASNATMVYVCNLMSRSGQTIGMHSREYVHEIAQYAGVMPQHVIYNTAPFSPTLLASYSQEGNHQVLNNMDSDLCTVHEIDVVSTQAYVTKAGDTVTRSLIRHDSEKLSQAIINLL
ncbi:YvcK family protein [Patescibacteria group bacterium]|nr:YvcK family protein [Patescibacteria group bacterium]